MMVVGRWPVAAAVAAVAVAALVALQQSKKSLPVVVVDSQLHSVAVPDPTCMRIKSVKGVIRAEGNRQC